MTTLQEVAQRAKDVLNVVLRYRCVVLAGNPPRDPWDAYGIGLKVQTVIADIEAALAQPDDKAQPVAHVAGDDVHRYLQWSPKFAAFSLPIGTALYAATQLPAEQPRPSDDDLWDQTLRERDDYHDWADRLAGAIAAHLGVEIGDHSNLNNPWQQAIEAIEPPKADQPPKRPENCGTSICSCIECPFEAAAVRPAPTYHHAPTDDTEGGAA